MHMAISSRTRTRRGGSRSRIHAFGSALAVVLLGLSVPGTAAAAPPVPAGPAAPGPGIPGNARVLDDAPVDGDASLRTRLLTGGARTAARNPTVVYTPLVAVATKAIWGTTQHVSYLWGGGHGATPPTNPDRTDCSGFTRWAYWTTLGYDISGNSSEGMRTSGQFTRTTAPQPGDVVFFGNGGRPPSYHIAIYIGRDAKGNRMIAENSSSKVEAHVSSLETPYRLQNSLGFYHLTAVKFVNPLTPTRITGASVPAAAKVGQKTTIGGLLWSAKDQKPIPAAEVLLNEQQADGSWKTLQRSTTAATGKYAFSLLGTGVLRRLQVQYTGNKYPFQTMRSAVFYQRGTS